MNLVKYQMIIKILQITAVQKFLFLKQRRLSREILAVMIGEWKMMVKVVENVEDLEMVMMRNKNQVEM